MRVVVLFSGGKDSTQAVKWCLDNGHEIISLIAVKPKSTEAYLWQYATVEWTKLQADAMGLPLKLINTDKIGSREEAEVIEEVMADLKQKPEAIVLGGVGLQETQIREVARVAERHGVGILVPYANLTSEQLLKEEVDSGLDIRITDVASDGLGPEWLGKKIDGKNLPAFLALARKFRFDPLGEGGYYNTFVADAPFFKKKVEFVKAETVWENATYSGHLEVKEARLIAK